MRGTEKLEGYLAKLKANKEKIPLAVLKTKYKAGYEKLTENIRAEAEAVFKPIAAEPPEWLAGRKIKPEYAEEIVKIFDSIYREGNYARRIGTALYIHYSITEARQLAKDINRKFRKELLAYFHSKTCIYATAENWDPEKPVPPRIYNPLIDKFYDAESGRWTEEGRPDNEAAMMIFTVKEEKTDGKPTEK